MALFLFIAILQQLTEAGACKPSVAKLTNSTRPGHIFQASVTLTNYILYY